MFYRFIVFIAICLTVTSCFSLNANGKNKAQLQQEILTKELDLLQKELALKELEVKLKKIEMEKLHAATPLTSSLTQLYKDAKQFVYLISNTRQQGKIIGSAFMISPDGVAISNYHVFKDAAEIVAYNQYDERFLITEILVENEEEDYVIFRIGPNDGNFKYCKLADEMPEVGEECFAIGNPRGLTLTLTNGLISSYRDHRRRLQTTTAISKGSSGGPLFNKKGEVIGITSSGFKSGDLNFAINIKSLPCGQYIRQDSFVIQKLSTYELINILLNYYDLIQREQLTDLALCYRDSVSRYHRLYNVDRYEAIADHEEYLKKYEVLNAEIVPNSLGLDFNGISHYLHYRLKWKIRNRTTDQEISYILETAIEIDLEGKIRSVYDNILKNELLSPQDFIN